MALDIQPGNILGHTLLTSAPDDLVIEREHNIAGEMYTCLVVPQPLSIDWRWDDDQLAAELYGIRLGDLGTGTLSLLYLLILRT